MSARRAAPGAKLSSMRAQERESQNTGHSVSPGGQPMRWGGRRHCVEKAGRLHGESDVGFGGPLGKGWVSAELAHSTIVRPRGSFSGPTRTRRRSTADRNRSLQSADALEHRVEVLEQQLFPLNAAKSHPLRDPRLVFSKMRRYGAEGLAGERADRTGTARRALAAVGAGDARARGAGWVSARIAHFAERHRRLHQLGWGFKAIARFTGSARNRWRGRCCVAPGVLPMRLIFAAIVILIGSYLC